MFEKHRLGGTVARWSRHSSIFIILVALALPGCAKFSQDPETLAPLTGGGDGSGGSGDGSGDDDGGESYVDEYGAQYTIGTPSNGVNINDRLFLGTKRAHPYVAPNGISYESLFAAHTALNVSSSLPIASRDTNARSQWDEGWTGKGVKVGIIDQFTDNDTIDSHGDKVSLVVNSVAPEAELLTRHSSLISTDVEAGWTNMSNNGYHIVNNSFGRPRVSHVDGSVDTDFDPHVTIWVNNRFKITGSATYDEDMLFIFAAGNSGDRCPDRRIHECTFRAAVLHGQRAAGVTDSEAYIWVGSLTDDGTGLTAYSHSAGEMADDFMVAHDDVLAQGDGAGTSFAAPRVAGAAALVRQKFPRLNGMQLKALLLHTAEDMGEPGPDPLFGHGKLDLENTLSPQGMPTSSLSDVIGNAATEGAPDGFGSDSLSLAHAKPTLGKGAQSLEGAALSVAALALFSAPMDYLDMSLIQLNLAPQHAASKTWHGHFTALNGEFFNTTHFYRNRDVALSARAMWSKPMSERVSLLVPLALDAGYNAELMQTRPMAGLGIGAAIGLGHQTILSVRAENIIRLGGQTSEQPCYDDFRRRFHCGTGMAWTDYQTSHIDRRGELGGAGFQARLIHRFSF